MRCRSAFGVTTFIATFALNPAYFAGCIGVSDDDPEFKYGAKEMAGLAKAASDSFEFKSGDAMYRADLAVTASDKAQQGSNRRPELFTSSAYACGDRKLYATAAACSDWSSMDVSGTMTLTRLGATKQQDAIIADEVALHGTLIVDSLILTSGDMELSYDQGAISLSSHDGATFALARFSGTALGAEKISIVAER